MTPPPQSRGWIRDIVFWGQKITSAPSMLNSWGSRWPETLSNYHKTFKISPSLTWWVSLVAHSVKNSPASDLGSIPEKGNDYPLQYTGLENSIERAAWQATVHGIAKSWIWLSNCHFTSLTWYFLTSGTK